MKTIQAASPSTFISSAHPLFRIPIMRFSSAFFVATVALPVFGAPTLVPITKRGGTLKENSYIITFESTNSQDSFVQSLQQVMTHPDSHIGHTYSVINGVSATVAPSDLPHVRKLAGVESIEQDQMLSLPPLEVFEDLPTKEEQPNDATYGNGGEGVVIYGLDTGIYIDHNCFEGRASHGWSAFGVLQTDDHGHGTHTAGTAIGKGYGIATKAHMVGVKVMNAAGMGQTSDIIKGIDYSCDESKKHAKPSIITMSIGGGVSDSLDGAVQNCITWGVHFTVAAGNDNKDAKDYSPARAPNANTVGAVDSKNVKAPFSNYGPVLDIQAPGVNIVSAGIIGPNSSQKASGTSMATPYVAGVLAVAISNHGNMSPEKLSNELKAHAPEVCTGMPDNTTTTRLAVPW
ncbi:peptidase, partial [Rhizoctonia solani]